MLKGEIVEKNSEIRNIQENLELWKSRTEEKNEENKQLRYAIKEADLAIQSLKEEVSHIKKGKSTINDVFLEKVSEAYEKRVKGLADELEFAKTKLHKRELEKGGGKSKDYSKIWSEDNGPASSINSSFSQKEKNKKEENKQLKNIIEAMTVDMEKISKSYKQILEENDKNKEFCLKLKNELAKMSIERDQLMEISNELRMELKMSILKKDFQEKLSPSNIETTKKIIKLNQSPIRAIKPIPKYKDFEEILIPTQTIKTKTPSYYNTSETSLQNLPYNHHNPFITKATKPIAGKKLFK
jgi:chromosome segregation ATPase